MRSAYSRTPEGHAALEGVEPRKRKQYLEKEGLEAFRLWRATQEKVITARNRLLRVYNLVCPD